MWEEPQLARDMSNAHFTEFGRKLGRMYHFRDMGYMGRMYYECKTVKLHMFRHEFSVPRHSQCSDSE
jgi:hypothetical protein